MTPFQSLGFAEPILRALNDLKFEAPTPIQAAVIPLALEGRDVLGIAQTGTGKTAAFVLPILQALAAERGGFKGPGAKQASALDKAAKPLMPKSARALILAPTRELAGQIQQSAMELGKHMRITTALVVGGAKPGPQIRALAPGVDLLIATPGRLQDHLQSRHVRLDQTTVAVLDEADQMMDLGFMPAIRNLLKLLPRSRQTLLLSATMPREIRSLADEFLTNPAEVAVAQADKPVSKIAQELVLVDPGKKPETLIGLLTNDLIDQAIVFTRTKHGADRVQKLVRDAGHYTVALHGDKTQGQRDRALAAFREGRIKVLVATDVAARGIDVEGVSHVFNYDLPNVPEAYVHRIGRTGRAGRSGTAISLCEPSEHGLARQIERLTGTQLLPESLRHAPRPGNKFGQKKPFGAKGRPSFAGKPNKPAGSGNTGFKPRSSGAHPSANAGGRPRRPANDR